MSAVSAAPGFASLAVRDRPVKARTGVRLTMRGRVLMGLLVLAVVLTVFTLGRISSSVAADESTGPTTRTLTVVPGASLWTVAGEIAPERDPREVIDAVRVLNPDLRADDTRGLVAGQQLVVPAYR